MKTMYEKCKRNTIIIWVITSVLTFLSDIYIQNRNNFYIDYIGALVYAVGSSFLRFALFGFLISAIYFSIKNFIKDKRKKKKGETTSSLKLISQ